MVHHFIFPCEALLTSPMAPLVGAIDELKTITIVNDSDVPL